MKTEIIDFALNPMTAPKPTKQDIEYGIAKISEQTKAFRSAHATGIKYEEFLERWKKGQRSFA